MSFKKKKIHYKKFDRRMFFCHLLQVFCAKEKNSRWNTFFLFVSKNDDKRRKIQLFFFGTFSYFFWTFSYKYWNFQIPEFFRYIVSENSENYNDNILSFMLVEIFMKYYVSCVRNLRSLDKKVFLWFQE